MSRVRLSDKADADFFEAYLYGIEKFGRVQAVRFIRDLRNTFVVLSEHPRLGSLWRSIDPRVRRHEHRSYVILYEETPEGILILAVVHASSLKRLDI